MWNDMDEQEKTDFWGWLVACFVVAILLLMVLTVHHALKTQYVAQAYEPPDRAWLSPYPRAPGGEHE